MSSKPDQCPASGTQRAPTYYETEPGADVNVNGDVCLHSRLFTYQTDSGIVAGWTMSVMCTIDRAAKDVWPHIKDFNLWHRDHYYSGVAADLEGKIFTLADKPEDVANSPYQYQVIRVIPEYLIVFFMPIPERDLPDLPGLGGISPGFFVIMLNEHGGKTILTILQQHASYASRGHDMTADEALFAWRNKNATPEWQRKWRDDFIPALKKLVYESG